MIMRRPSSRTPTRRDHLAEGTPNAQVTATEVKEQAKGQGCAVAHPDAPVGALLHHVRNHARRSARHLAGRRPLGRPPSGRASAQNRARGGGGSCQRCAAHPAIDGGEDRTGNVTAHPGYKW